MMFCIILADFDMEYNDCHRFCLHEIQATVETSDSIECPKHGGSVPISELVRTLVS